jgi:hypothetical protein
MEKVANHHMTQVMHILIRFGEQQHIMTNLHICSKSFRKVKPNITFKLMQAGEHDIKQKNIDKI